MKGPRDEDPEPEPPDIDENGVDRAQIRAMLRLTPEQRLLRVQDVVESLLEIRDLNAPRPRPQVYNPGMALALALDPDRLAAFCERWKVAELAVFGSALRADFGPESDIDFLASFSEEADWSLLDHVAMSDDLSNLIGRRIDLVTRRAVERSQNWIRRRAILESAEPVYVAR